MSDKTYPTIINIDYFTVDCPNCGGKLYNHYTDDDIPLDGCTIGESCDEGGGTTGYHAICHNKRKES